MSQMLGTQETGKHNLADIFVLGSQQPHHMHEPHAKGALVPRRPPSLPRPCWRLASHPLATDCVACCGVLALSVPTFSLCSCPQGSGLSCLLDACKGLPGPMSDMLPEAEEFTDVQTIRISEQGRVGTLTQHCTLRDSQTLQPL